MENSDASPFLEQEQSKFYSPLQAVAIAIFIYFVAQIVGGLLIAVIPLVNGWDKAQTNNWISSSSWAQFLFVLFVEVTTLRLIWEFLKRRKLKFKTIGFNKPKMEHIVYASLGFIVYLAIYLSAIFIISMLVPSLRLDQKQELGFNSSSVGLNLLPIFISLVLLPPLVEEIVARGFLFTGLRTKLTFITSAIITSLLFAAAHLGASKDGLLWVAGIDTFILSMIMCKLRENTGSLWPSIGVHFIKNSLAFFVLFNIAQYFR